MKSFNRLSPTFSHGDKFSIAGDNRHNTTKWTNEKLDSNFHVNVVWSRKKNERNISIKSPETLEKSLF